MVEVSPAPAVPRSRRLLALLGRLYVVALLAVAVAVLVTSREEVAAALRGARPAVLVAVPLLACGQLVLTSALWRGALGSFGAPVPLRTVLVATASSAPARYLPGSIWFAASRVAMLRRAGAPVRVLTAVATLETVLVPVLGFALGGAVLAATGAGLHGVLGWPVLVAALALLVLASPPVVNAALRLRVREGEPPVLSWAALLRTAGWVSLWWAWSASVFAVYVLAFPGLTSAGLLTVAGAYAVAWGIGWLTPFAPQGLGVTEVVLAALVLDGSARLAVVLAGYRGLIAVRDVGCGLLARAVKDA